MNHPITRQNVAMSLSTARAILADVKLCPDQYTPQQVARARFVVRSYKPRSKFYAAIAATRGEG